MVNYFYTSKIIVSLIIKMDQKKIVSSFLIRFIYLLPKLMIRRICTMNKYRKRHFVSTLFATGLKIVTRNRFIFCAISSAT